MNDIISFLSMFCLENWIWQNTVKLSSFSLCRGDRSYDCECGIRRFSLRFVFVVVGYVMLSRKGRGRSKKTKHGRIVYVSPPLTEKKKQ